jgi:hypothetical protein
MIAELLLLQGLLDKTNMVTPPESSVTTSTSTYGKAQEAVKDYRDKVTSYLKRFRR